MSRIKVMVMMGGPSVEYDVSLSTGAMVAKALAQNPEFSVETLVIDEQGQWHRGTSIEQHHQLNPGNMTRISRAQMIKGIAYLQDVDVVFLAFHGSFGEDGTVQGLLTALDLPYTGSGPLASALAMDKVRAKEVFRCSGLDTPKHVAIDIADWDHDIKDLIAMVADKLTGSLVVKPTFGGSSVGVVFADSVEDLTSALKDIAARRTAILIEPRLVGREVTCPVLENLDGTVQALPVIEIIPQKSHFFDFRSKYDDEGSLEICPADLSQEQTQRVQNMAIAAHHALGCRGFSRSDMFFVEDELLLLEVNTIPGMTPNSLLPKSAAAAGINFGDLMTHLVELARQKR